jgi:hypothetical protein
MAAKQQERELESDFEKNGLPAPRTDDGAVN